MKIQCDVCSSVEASVFCCADEAALCDACDRRIHRANKLASKHRRFSLHHPSSRPLCDVCQERTGFVFCQQDRAILCRDCDVSIHNTSSLTMKHSRFLLTGVSLSAAPMGSPPFCDEENEVVVSSRDNCQRNDQELAVSVSSSSEAMCNNGGGGAATNESCCSSSISEYLTKMLPGWHVEDFLTDDSAATTAGDSFSQMEEALPFLESDDVARWVHPYPPADHSGRSVAATVWVHNKEARLNQTCMNPGQTGLKANRRRGEDAFAVPQIYGGDNKRSRATLWSF